MAKNHYSMFTNASNVYISGGTFHNGPVQVSMPADHARDLLANHIAPNALPDSDAMYDGPKCYPETRMAIHRKLGRWIRQQDDVDTKFIWLQGGAGAGKSAIMRTVAMAGPSKQDDTYPDMGVDANMDADTGTNKDVDSDLDLDPDDSDNPHILGSFFFSRQDPTRNTARTLIPTLALQLCDAHPTARAAILQAVADKRERIFTTSLQNQVSSLLVEPLRLLEAQYGWLSRTEQVQDKRRPGRVFVIDGLDECADENKQSEVIEALAILVEKLPVRVLLASRPDKPIPSAIRHCSSLRGIVSDICLSDDPDSEADIRFFLEETLKEASKRWRSQPFGALPDPWPTEADVDELVRKSSNHFIFASTTEKYIASGHERPDVALRVILGLQAPRTGQPFNELDTLYRYILGKAHFQKEALEIISFVVFMRQHNRTDQISYFLGYPPGDIGFFLSDMCALATINTSNKVHLQHRSFEDFLKDKSRAREFYIGTSGQFHCDHLQRYLTLLDGYIATSHVNWLSFKLVQHIATGIAASPLSDATTVLIQQHPPELIYTFLTLCSGDHIEWAYGTYMRAIRQYDFQNSCVYEDTLTNFLRHIQQTMSSSAPDSDPTSIFIPLLLAGFDIDRLYDAYMGLMDPPDRKKLRPIFEAFHFTNNPISLCKRHRYPVQILHQICKVMVDADTNLAATTLKMLKMITKHPGTFSQTKTLKLSGPSFSLIKCLMEVVTFVLPKVDYRRDIAFYAACQLPTPSEVVLVEDRNLYVGQFQGMVSIISEARRAMDNYLRRGGDLAVNTSNGGSEPGNGTEANDSSTEEEPPATFPYNPECGVCKRLQGVEIE